MTLKDIFSNLPQRTSQIVQKSRYLTPEEAIKLIEHCFDPSIKTSVSDVIKGSTRLLANGGYEYVGLFDIDRAKAWAPCYIDRKGNKAQLSIELKPLSQKVSIGLTDNFLNLDFIPLETARKLKVPIHPLEHLLNSGFAVDVKPNNPQFDCIYQTSVTILYYKPFGNREYKRDYVLHQEIKSLIG